MKKTYEYPNSAFTKFSLEYGRIALAKSPLYPKELGVLCLIAKQNNEEEFSWIEKVMEIFPPERAYITCDLIEKGYITEVSDEDNGIDPYRLTKKAKDLIEKVEVYLEDDLLRIEKRLGKARFAELSSLMEEAYKALIE